MRVLVTGHRGYIGSVLAGVLRRARFDVVGLDCDLYRACDFGRMHETGPSFDCDLREIEFADLVSFDAVVHLAELPESASPGFDPFDAGRVNRDMTLRLAHCCKKAGVHRFLFASSCALYGRGGARPCVEEDAGDPQTVQARTKSVSERALRNLAEPGFGPVMLRVPTVYGVSPRLRLDLALNDMVASAVANERIVVGSDARAWRPFVHVEDLARALAVVLMGSDEQVGGQAFNVVAPDDNYRLIDVADLVTELVPGSVRSISPYAFDEPSYRVDGGRFARTFPEFSFRWTLSKGIVQLRNAMRSAGLTMGEWRSDRYRRLLHLLAMIERGEIEAGAPTLRPVGVENALTPIAAE